MSEEQVKDPEAQETGEDDGFPNAWRAERKGDRVKGKILEIRAIDPSGQGSYPCLTLDTDEGPMAVHAFRTVLRRELARCAPRIGDEIEIIYTGKRTGGTYGEYHGYRVSGGQAREFDWSQELPPEERRQTSEPPIAPKPLTAQERVEAELPPVPEMDQDDLPF